MATPDPALIADICRHLLEASVWLTAGALSDRQAGYLRAEVIAPATEAAAKLRQQIVAARRAAQQQDTK